MSNRSDEVMDRLLKELMAELESIGETDRELYDTDVREQMFEAILNGFLKPQTNFILPQKFGMFSPAANEKIYLAISKYLQAANLRANEIALNEPKDRLAAFQNNKIHTDGEEQYPDDFFGWADAI